MLVNCLVNRVELVAQETLLFRHDVRLVEADLAFIDSFSHTHVETFCRLDQVPLHLLLK